MTTRLVPLASIAALSLALLSGCSFFPGGTTTVDSGDVANAAEDWLDDDEDVKYSVECEDDEVELAEDESVDCVATDDDTDLEYDVEITITDVDGEDFEVEVDRDSDPRDSDDSDSDDEDSDDSDSEGSGGDDVFSLVVGDCFNDAENIEGADSVNTVDIVDCDELHEREVYASDEFEGADDEYPGETSVTDDADAFCIDEFESFVGIPYDDSVLYFLTFYPTEDSWSEGDREVLCLISEYDADDNVVEVEGSLEDSAR